MQARRKMNMRKPASIGLAAIALGAILYRITPQQQLQSQRPDLATALYASWEALLNQPQIAQRQHCTAAVAQPLREFADFLSHRLRLLQTPEALWPPSLPMATPAFLNPE